MDDDYREPARRLLAAATAMLEDAIELSTEGPAPRLSFQERQAQMEAGAKAIRAKYECVMLSSS